MYMVRQGGEVGGNASGGEGLGWARKAGIAMDNQHDRSKAPGLPDVEQTLLLLRLVKLTDDEIVTALRQFGALRLLDARASVEQRLESRNPRVRVAALETLLLSWKLSEHVESA